MTDVIVNDASCLIDLKKGRLLHAMLSLPFRFIVPLPVRVSELLDFTDQEWRMLDDGGVVTHDLEAEGIADALTLKSTYPRLSANDCICLATTMRQDNAVLLTGDGLLRSVADSREVRVHGVLWLLDRLDDVNADRDLLHSALEIWRDDVSVFLPPDQIELRLKRLS